MIKFNSNSILLVEGDQTYARQLKQILEDRGAMVVLSSTVNEAKTCLNHSDFDLVIATHKLPDGNVRELFDWAKDSLSTLPTLAAIGNCTQFEKKQLEKSGVTNFFSKKDSVKLFDDISRALFSIDDFKKNYLDSKCERGISCELSASGKKIAVKALEIMDKGVFLSFDVPFAAGNSAMLRLTCTEDLHIDSVSVSGVLQGEFSEGQFFRVNDEELTKWRNLLSQLYQKQDEVIQFLKKASGK